MASQTSQSSPLPPPTKSRRKSRGNSRYEKAHKHSLETAHKERSIFNFKSPIDKNDLLLDTTKEACLWGKTPLSTEVLSFDSTLPKASHALEYGHVTGVPSADLGASCGSNGTSENFDGDRSVFGIGNDPFWEGTSECLAGTRLSECDDLLSRAYISTPIPSLVHSNTSTSDESLVPASNGVWDDAWDYEAWDTTPRITLKTLDARWKYALMEKRWNISEERGLWFPASNREFYDRFEANEAAAQQIALEFDYNTSRLASQTQYYNASGLSGWKISDGETSLRLHVTRESFMAPASTNMLSFAYRTEKYVLWEITKTTIQTLPQTLANKNTTPCKRKEAIQTESIGGLFKDLRLANHRAKDIVDGILAPDSTFPHSCSSLISVVKENMPPPSYEACVIMDSETRILIRVCERSLESLRDDFLRIDPECGPELSCRQWR